ncbi:CoA-transferase [Stenotrophomonas humi]|uniref:CoA-transferase n=1 Tax=Stenotrophomonas humi TaxID=405444 RepID=A0A0R0CCY0_9GAMM|nr:CoA transferase [Stenotrophomonas humi]KRG63748.1 CoA-transferase [Stenotrophomonas humi]
MKLEGVRVLDLSLFLPGPHLTMVMADHGADVIKIEPPTGEPVREVGLKQAGVSTWFRNTHRGKRCIVLDLKNAEGKAAFVKLVEWADVVVEAFRPGVAKRLGIDYDSCKAINPKLVYCAISAFGQTGPKVNRPAHDLAMQADTGVVSLNRAPDGTPAMPHMPVADMAGSLMALNGILMALFRRERTGEGDYIDLSMQDALMAWLPNVLGPPFALGRDPVVNEERSWGGNALYKLYRCSDERWIALGGAEHKFAENLLIALGRPDLIHLCHLPPGPGQDPVKAFLIETFSRRTLVEWTLFLHDIDVCWAPVKTLTEAFNDPHTRAREMVWTDEQGGTHLGIPIKFANEPGRINPHLDDVGESTVAVLKELGLTPKHL